MTIPHLNEPGENKYRLRADIVRQLEREESANPGSVKLCPHGLPLTLGGKPVPCPACKGTPREVYTQDAAGRKRENIEPIE